MSENPSFESPGDKEVRLMKQLLERARDPNRNIDALIDECAELDQPSRDNVLDHFEEVRSSLLYDDHFQGDDSKAVDRVLDALKDAGIQHSKFLP
jgi:hypothetical protein